MSSRRPLTVLLFLIVVATGFTGFEARSDGTLDSSFNGSGKVITNLPKRRDDYLNAMAIQADGRVVAAGYTNVEGTYDFALARYNTDGTLDTSFGTGGFATVDFGSSTDYGYALAIQSGDGKIVVVGASAAPGFYGFAVARLNPNGTPDTAFFGTGGKVTTHFGASSSDSAQAVAIQPDGKIVVAGYSNAGGTDDIALARYLGNGDLDTSFGTGGLVTTNFAAGSTDRALSVTLDASAKIVVAGFTNASGTYDFALARYNTNGSLDGTFGSGGVVTTNFFGVVNGDDFASSVRIQPDGKIVAAGNTTAYMGHDFALVRYNANGTLDVAFGTGGRVATSFVAGNDTEEVMGLAIQPDGKIVTAGLVTGGSHDFAAVRYNANGSVDSSFGTSGFVRTDLGTGTVDEGTSMVMQADGKIVVGGSTKFFDDFDFGLVRYGTNGVLDSTFGELGVNVSNFPGQPKYDVAYGVAVQGDGKIVAVGATVSGLHDAFAVVRYQPDGTLDPTFGVAGVVTASFNANVDDDAYAVAIQSDGKIVVAGTSTVGYGKPNFALRRFNTDGSPDNGFGTGGAVWSQFSMTTQDVAQAVAIQSDGKIVAGGYTMLSGNYDFALMRYDTNGTLDPTFGTGGMLKTNFGGTSHETITALAIQSNGRILAAGYSNFAGPYDFAVARYNTNGALDSTWAGGGVVLTGVGAGTNSYGYAIAIQSNGKVVVAGNSLQATNAVGLARFNTDGTLDGTFGTSGIVRLNFGAGTSDTANAVALQADGKIVVGGSTNISGNLDFAVSRFAANGAADGTFGFGGLNATNFSGSSFEAVTAVAIQTDGRIVAAGYTNAQGSGDFALARYIVCSTVSPFASNDGPICNGATLHLYASPSILDATYSWTGPNGFTSGAQNPTISNCTAANVGDYHVTIMPFGCSASTQATTSVSLIVDGTGPTVTAPPAATVVQTTCQ